MRQWESQGVDQPPTLASERSQFQRSANEPSTPKTEQNPDASTLECAKCDANLLLVIKTLFGAIQNSMNNLPKKPEPPKPPMLRIDAGTVVFIIALLLLVPLLVTGFFAQ